MPFDFSRIAAQIDGLAREVPRGGADEFGPLRQAYANVDTGDLVARLTDPRTRQSWTPARPVDTFNGAHPAPPAPADFSVLATDGSFILPDRHSPARFYLINIGRVHLHYGARPDADLSSVTELRYREQEMRIAGHIPVNSTILGLKRATDELAALAALAQDAPRPAVALQDGTLILWALAGQDRAVQEWVLPDFLAALDALRERGIPVASYISYPGGDDVLDALRLAVCDFPARGRPIDCDACRRERDTPACAIIPALPDRQLFEHIARLAPGERSDVYASTSKILRDYGEHAIHFFYLHTGVEIARVEIPAWVAQHRPSLDLLHAALYDQCRRGRGYPSVLQEAHEQAVIHGDERRVVEQLVEEALARLGVVMLRSAKDASKRSRFV
ncbi:MAG TPA: DNA double-strand break repair nuclease NurA [Thermomicrobiales bacterium]|nr:DNA double-strand break repair nuclease NurA [Thermomicrobiales bacterium]